MKAISSENMQTSTSGLEGRTLASGCMLVGPLLLISLLTTIFSFPVLTSSVWKNELVVYQLFSQLGKRIYTIQKVTIVNQIQTGLYWDIDENQIIFRMSQPDEASWKVLDIPDETTLKRHASIALVVGTGNGNSLKAYQFHWEEKGQTIMYRFQIGSGRYTKRIE